jgi:hypothetical protein
LLSEITNNQMKGATMTLARIAKREYGDNIKAVHEFENAPLVELVVTKPVADGLAGLEKLQNGGD